MALTEKSAAQRAYLYLKQRRGSVDANFIPRALAALPDALSRLSKRIAASSDFHNAQKEFALTAVAGRVDLSLANTSANKILFDCHRSRVFVGNSDDPAVYVERMETLKNGSLPSDAFYFSQRGQSLIFLNTDGSTATLAGAVKVVANFVWAIAEVPPEYEKELIDILVEIGSADPQSMAANATSAQEGIEVGRV